MNDDSSLAPEPRTVAPPPPLAAAPRGSRLWRWSGLLALLLTVLSIVSLTFAWRADQRVRSSERELVKRQQESADRVAEATLLARQAQDGMRDATAKVALLEARLNEVALQRGQLEDLIQSVARSRDENLVADVESAIRAAVQQSALTGSAEPLVAALKQSDERLARASQPRLEPVRRAITRDLDRVKAANVADVATLSIKVDEVVRLIDELPLLSAAEPRRDFGADARRVPAAAPPPAASASAVDGISEWFSREFARASRFVADNVWSEIRSLVRITRIDQPEAMLVAPDQAFFLRENLKLRLLNVRLALLARQFDAAQADLKWAQGAIERYFDRSAKRTQIASDMLRQVALQSRQAGIARPDDTLAALAAAGARR
ncbi:MAG: uroporphyrinogen-III C-methyltransferase [Caldimonas sp.]